MTLKDKAIYSVKWSAIEKSLSLGIQFILSLFIARILSPSDYGTVGLLSVFIAISNTFISSGFGAALVRKTDRTQTDYSTVFYFNILVAISFYCILFISAPFIAQFYEIPELTLITRIVGLNLIISSLFYVQKFVLIIELNFKKQALIAIIQISLSGILGFWLAYKGLGVWALIFQTLFSSIIALILFSYKGWIPSRSFSKTSFSKMFHFSSKLLGADLLRAFFDNIQSIVIGRFFSPSELGFYSRANGYAQMPNSIISGTIGQVALPILARFQDTPDQLLHQYRRVIALLSYLVFPISGLLFSLSVPLIEVLITSKWLPSVPYLRLLSLACIFYPISNMQMNLITVIGKSGLYLKLEILKKIFIAISLVATIPFGVIGLCYSTLTLSILFFVINSIILKKIFNYGWVLLISDIRSGVLSFGIVVSSSSLCITFFNNQIVQIVLSILSSLFIVIIVSLIFRLEEFTELIKISNKKK